ncbi:LOW QUALITY PROTEIN: HARB1-like protein, partial [Mya arenaria]
MTDLFTALLIEELSDADDMQTINNDTFHSSHNKFCCTRSIQDLCKTVWPLMVKNRSITVQKRLLATLWLLNNQESHRGVADRFGALHLTVMETCQVLFMLMSDLIQFPRTIHYMKDATEGFMARCGFPGGVGAIDGTHIPIPTPTIEHRASFINRKEFASMILQVVCDSNLEFLDVYTGCPGSVHDARKQIHTLPEEFQVLGDSAYPLSKYVLFLYRDNGHLDNTEKKFNKCHTSTRVDVERFIEELQVVISSCCVLYNLISNHENDSNIDADPVDDGVEEQAYNGQGR